MAGTKAGGLKARDTNLKNHGKDFYQKIGQKGGKAGTTGGFYNNPERARMLGRIGGMKSRRGKSAKTLALEELREKERQLDALLDKPCLICGNTCPRTSTGKVRKNAKYCCYECRAIARGDKVETA